MNSSRMNRLEELGRVDAEKADTSKGKRNLKDEKKRIVRELKASGGPAGTGKGAAPFKGPRKPTRPKPTPPRNKKSMGGRTNYKSGGAAKRGRGCEIK